MPSRLYRGFKDRIDFKMCKSIHSVFPHPLVDLADVARRQYSDTIEGSSLTFAVRPPGHPMSLFNEQFAALNLIFFVRAKVLLSRKKGRHKTHSSNVVFSSSDEVS